MGKSGLINRYARVLGGGGGEATFSSKTDQHDAKVFTSWRSGEIPKKRETSHGWLTVQGEKKSVDFFHARKKSVIEYVSEDCPRFSKNAIRKKKGTVSRAAGPQKRDEPSGLIGRGVELASPKSCDRINS